MLELEEAARIAKEIYEDISANIANIETEEDAKIQAINRVLVECLGWFYSDFKAERQHENGYSDYILTNSDKAALLIEAKRIGILKVITAEKDKIKYFKISGTSLKGSIEGIEQAASYSLLNGIPVSVLTDGVTWIIFKSFITGESYKNKEAIVFPSFNAILNDFSVFYDLLSKKQYNKRLYNSIFDELHNRRVVLEKELIAALPASEIKMISKTPIAYDLNRIFEVFFDRLTGTGDDNFLIECFVESRESKIADFSLEKITASILSNIAPANKDISAELTNLIKLNVETENLDHEEGQTIFIVGPTGAGKTTFLERFFHKTLPLQVRKRCIVVNINCLDSTGREETALAWLTENIISSLERQLYEDGVPLWNDLRGLYNMDYIKQSKGVGAILYNSDKDKFKQDFSDFMSEKIQNDREGYLERTILNIVNNRKMLPILIIDNTDEFSNDFKQRVFQFSQSLRRKAKHCLLLFPVTDKSAWTFSKTDIYGIYRSKSFFLPTPSPKEVFRKRIEFIKNKAKIDVKEKRERGEYFSNKGIQISIENMSNFAVILENIFVDHEYTSKTLGELTNYNIRRTLALSQRVITSPIIKIEDIIKSYISGKILITNFSKFIDALLKGDYEAFKVGDKHEVYPVFQVDTKFRQSPLLSLRLLSLLDSVYRNGNSIEEKHLSVQSIIDYFDSIGCYESSVENCILSLLEAGLVEPYDVSNRDLSNNQRLTISYKGASHLRLATRNGVFLYQMALTTGITNEEIAFKIREIYNSDALFTSKVFDIRKLFIDFLISEDQKYVSIHSLNPQYDHQLNLIKDINILKGNKLNPEGELERNFGNKYKKGLTREAVIATVDFYDSVNGFGFVELEDNSKAYIGKQRLKSFGIKFLKDGDIILCDIARADKGEFVLKIHSLEKDISRTDVVNCKVVRIFRDRGYGFAQIKDNAAIAHFYLSVFDQKIREEICPNYQFRAEIGKDRKGRGLQIKYVIT